MINFDARNLSIFSTGETPLQVTQARVSHTGFFLVSRVFTRRNNTNNHLYVSIRGSMCPSMKTRAGLECRERVKPTAIYQAFFFLLLLLLLFFFKLPQQWQPRLFIADEYALAAVKPRHRVWNSSRLFVDLFSKTGEKKTELAGPRYSWRISVLDTVVGKQCHPRPFTALPMHLNAGASTRGVGRG